MSTHLHDIVVSAEEIQGIIYFVDDHNNVYHTDDVLYNTGRRRIIAKLNTNYQHDTIEERVVWFSEYAPLNAKMK
jgi:hypothetical protein